MDNELVDKMIFIKNGKQRLPLFVAKVNGRFIVAAYQWGVPHTLDRSPKEATS